MSKTCTECRHPIPNGQAVIRSVSLQRVYFHQDCYDLKAERDAQATSVAWAS